MESIAANKSSSTQEESKGKLVLAFREQSYLWRAIALMQIPTTLIAIIVALIVYVNSDTIVEVSPRPAPGYYLTREIPDEEFVKVAIEYVNLISSYQPAIAERQFKYALNFLMEPEYSAFRKQFLAAEDGKQSELDQIRQIQRAQMFFIYRDLIIVRRIDDPEDSRNSTVEVRIPGELIKFFNGVKQDRGGEDHFLAYYISMRTFPKTTFNQNGIYVVDFKLITKIGDRANITLYEDLRQEDTKEQGRARKRKKEPGFKNYKWR